MATVRRKATKTAARRPRAEAAPAGRSEAPEQRDWRRSLVNDRLSFLVKEAVRGFTRSLQVRLTEHGVSIGHYVFLRALWVEDGVTQRELAERVGLMESTACTAIHALAKLGYVTRVKKPGNNKRVYVFLTPRGRWLKVSLTPVLEEINGIATEGISGAHLTILRRSLLRIIDNFAADETRWAEEKMRMPSTRDIAKVLNASK